MSYNIANAYDIRDDLKAVGGTYHAPSKDWTITDEAFAKLNARSHAYGMRWVKGWAKATKTKMEG